MIKKTPLLNLNIIRKEIGVVEKSKNRRFTICIRNSHIRTKHQQQCCVSKKTRFVFSVEIFLLSKKFHVFRITHVIRIRAMLTTKIT